MSIRSVLSSDQQRRLKFAAIAGAVVLAVGFAIPAFQLRVWGNLLLVAFYLLTIALGGSLFIALSYAVGAGWNVAFRRIPEAMSKLLPIAGLAMLAAVAIRLPHYGWHHPGEGGPGTFWFKEMWLSPGFLILRAAAYVVLWVLLSRCLVSNSLRQDASGDPRLSSVNAGVSYLFLAVYAATFSLASIDWILALDPMWFSTMWGVYHFSGMIQATLAVIIILGLLLRLPGAPLDGVFNDEHLHDLGKLLLGFSCFWMYIWFSQYMLIWYSNIPEETMYFIPRTQGPWGPVVVATILLNWVIPFFVLLPKPAKRNASVMMKVAVVVLIGRWVDLYVMVFPSQALVPPGHSEIGPPAFGIWEVAAIALLVGVAGTLFFRSFPYKSPVPKNDPYLPESLHYHC